MPAIAKLGVEAEARPALELLIGLSAATSAGRGTRGELGPRPGTLVTRVARCRPAVGRSLRRGVAASARPGARASGCRCASFVEGLRAHRCAGAEAASCRRLRAGVGKHGRGEHARQARRRGRAGDRDASRASPLLRGPSRGGADPRSCPSRRRRRSVAWSRRYVCFAERGVRQPRNEVIVPILEAEAESARSLASTLAPQALISAVTRGYLYEPGAGVRAGRAHAAPGCPATASPLPAPGRSCHLLSRLTRAARSGGVARRARRAARPRARRRAAADHPEALASRRRDARRARRCERTREVDRAPSSQAVPRGRARLLARERARVLVLASLRRLDRGPARIADSRMHRTGRSTSPQASLSRPAEDREEAVVALTNTASGPCRHNAVVLPTGVVLHRLEPHADSRGVFTELFRDSWAPRGRAGAVERGPLGRPTCSAWRPCSLAACGLPDRGRRRATIGLSRPARRLADRGARRDCRAAPSAGRSSSIPPGVAHGFYFHEPSLHVYAVEHEWDPADELGCRWDDPELEIAWPCASRSSRARPRARVAQRAPRRRASSTRSSRRDVAPAQAPRARGPHRSKRIASRLRARGASSSAEADCRLTKRVAAPRANSSARANALQPDPSSAAARSARLEPAHRRPREGQMREPRTRRAAKAGQLEQLLPHVEIGPPPAGAGRHPWGGGDMRRACARRP